MRTACITGFIGCLLVSSLGSPAVGESLRNIVSDPFHDTKLTSFAGDLLTTNIDAGNEVLKAEIGQAISLPIRASLSQLPVASASASFTYEYDPKIDLFVRSTDTLGPLFAERTQTLGKGKFAATASYTHVDYDSLDGQNLNHYTKSLPVGQTLRGVGGNALPGIEDDVVNLSADLGIRSDTIFLAFTYGVLDRLDIGIALPIVFVNVKGDYNLTIEDRGDPPSGSPGHLNRLAFVKNGSLGDVASARFDQSREGVGSIYLRAKYRFLESQYVDSAAVLTLTLPTGGADDFLGFQNVTGTPLLVLSKSFDWITPHLNAGFAIRDAQDVGQGVWALGAELKAFSWLTVVPDFLGYHDVIREGTARDDVYQSSIGFKVNPFGQFVGGFNLQFPLNRDQGLRADVIYSVQLEATF